MHVAQSFDNQQNFFRREIMNLPALVVCKLAGDCESEIFRKVNGWRVKQWIKYIVACRQKSLYDRASLSVVAFRSHFVTCARRRFLDNSKQNPLWSELFKAIASLNDDSYSADISTKPFSPNYQPYKSLVTALRCAHLFEFSLDEIVVIC